MDEKDLYLEELDKTLRELDRIQLRSIILDAVEDLPNNIMLVMLDQAGKFIYTSKRWTEFFGYRYAELKGQNFLEFVHPEDLERTQNAWTQKPDILTPFRNRYRHKEGQYLAISWQPTRSKQREVTTAYAWPSP